LEEREDRDESRSIRLHGPLSIDGLKVDCKALPRGFLNTACTCLQFFVEEGLENAVCCVNDNGDFAESLRDERTTAEIPHEDDDVYGFHCTRTDENQNYRYKLYGDFISKYSLGGRGRVEIPLCYVNAVREIWPSSDGCYKGFKFKG
jgi:hypothetical protein